MFWKFLYLILALLSVLVGCYYGLHENYAAGAYYWLLYLVNIKLYNHE